jgi:tetratricopeptide (TPR) repeat protein
MKCNSCGIESPIDQAFRPMTRLFQKPTRFCPSCAEKHDWRELKVALLFMAAIAALFVLAAFTLEKSGPKRNELLVFPLCFLIYPLNVVLHEFAHVVTAWLVGLRVFNIFIGFRGPVLWRSKRFQAEIRLTCAPFDGLVLVAPPSLAHYRLRIGAVYAAGPLMNALLVAATYWLPRWSLTLSLWGTVVFWSNAALLAVSLFPWRHRGPQGVFASDGLALLTLPFVKRKSFEERHAAYFVLEGLASIKNKDFPAAIEWAERGLREHSGAIGCRNILGMGQLGLDQFDLARATFTSCVADSETNLANKAIFLFYLAWTELGRADSRDLEMIDRASEEASTLTPWAPTIQATRGAALVELGRFDEGIALLTKALNGNEGLSKAVIASYLSLAFAKQGAHDRSRVFLEKARKFDPSCPILARIEKQISSVRSGTCQAGAASTASVPE